MGSELAFGLFEKGHQVTVIDQVGASFQHLHPAYRGRTIEAEVLNQDVLQRAGIEQADGLAAVTNSDATNAVVAHVARTIFKVPNVVGAQLRPALAASSRDPGPPDGQLHRLGRAAHRGDPARGPSAAASSRPGNGEVEVYELAVGRAWSGRSLQDLLGPTECVAVALTRAGKASLPAPRGAARGRRRRST